LRSVLDRVGGKAQVDQLAGVEEMDDLTTIERIAC
jgi:hypothetical protein